MEYLRNGLDELERDVKMLSNVLRRSMLDTTSGFINGDGDVISKINSDVRSIDDTIYQIHQKCVSLTASGVLSEMESKKIANLYHMTSIMSNSLGYCKEMINLIRCEVNVSNVYYIDVLSILVLRVSTMIEKSITYYNSGDEEIIEECNNIHDEVLDLHLDLTDITCKFVEENKNACCTIVLLLVASELKRTTIDFKHFLEKL